ncbi:N-formylglutamate deformylase [Colwellia sp. 4_MG-2023]|jgi:N-formylglutamate deformylase|uniref:N-formylglutamate deformylase n=1 Tax=unclassified Colwellia TaxID=196834 RepID=UPI0026E2B58E|nr:MULTISPECIES: N-formylglutamate deformylase [unclassified Colwellia]MDO6505683.1 N-formylglutamate deformylase [Colwellia sp. 5_MG-2023]MDO6554364.1 N-formylglutamate deformylase [Colwellia sp. 4_MG-2023]
MNASYSLTSGNIGMLISMPHNGQLIPKHIANNMTENGHNVADTDWYIDKLYDFATAMGIYTLIPKYSRYVIDLNRSPSGVALYAGADNTELCPTTAFDLSPLYHDGNNPTPEEITSRIENYWQPYHQVLAETLLHLKRKYKRVVLLDAHSILSQVPRFFSGRLPDFNFGSADGTSCDQALIDKIQELDLSPFSTIFNGRFKGGYITRAYGNPKDNIHAIQLELSQSTYLDEPSNHYNEQKANNVKEQLKKFVQCLAEFTTQDL